MIIMHLFVFIYIQNFIIMLKYEYCASWIMHWNLFSDLRMSGESLHKPTMDEVTKLRDMANKLR